MKEKSFWQIGVFSAAIFIMMFISVGCSEESDDEGRNPEGRSWSLVMSSTDFNEIRDMEQTRDGGFIAVGDAAMVKINDKGAVVWSRLFYQPDKFAGYNYLSSVEQTIDGGYIMAGGVRLGREAYIDLPTVAVASTEASGLASEYYLFWLVKTDEQGEISWQKYYGASLYGDASLKVTPDNGYILAGATRSYGKGVDEVLVFKLNALGEIQWQKTYGGPDYDSVNCITTTRDGGYIFAGKTQSFDIDSAEVWVVKTDGTGNIAIQKTFGGDAVDEANYIQQTEDGGYIVAGGTYSFGNGGIDSWVLKLNSVGDVEWQKTYGGKGDEAVSVIRQTLDGGYIMVGSTSSFDVKYEELWLLELDAEGEIVWQKIFGDNFLNQGYTVLQTDDGDFAAAGKTDSFNEGEKRAWILKLYDDGQLLGDCPRRFVNDTEVNVRESDCDLRRSNAIPWNAAAPATDAPVSIKDLDVSTKIQCGG